jgi:hypothetical protein
MSCHASHAVLTGFREFTWVASRQQRDHEEDHRPVAGAVGLLSTDGTAPGPVPTPPLAATGLWAQPAVLSVVEAARAGALPAPSLGRRWPDGDAQWPDTVLNHTLSILARVAVRASSHVAVSSQSALTGMARSRGPNERVCVPVCRTRPMTRSSPSRSAR